MRPGTDLMKTAGFVLREGTDAPESVRQVMANHGNKLVIVNYSDRPSLAPSLAPASAHTTHGTIVWAEY